MGYDVVVEVRFQVVFDDHPVFLADVNQVAEQRTVLRPVFLLAQELNAFGETLEAFHHAFGQPVFVAPCVELAMVLGEGFGQGLLPGLRPGDVGLAFGLGSFELRDTRGLGGLRLVLGGQVGVQYLHFSATVGDVGQGALHVAAQVLHLIALDGLLFFQLDDLAFGHLLGFDELVQVAFQQLVAATAAFQLDAGFLQGDFQLSLHIALVVHIGLITVYFPLQGLGLLRGTGDLVFQPAQVVLHERLLLHQHVFFIFLAPDAAGELVYFLLLAAERGFLIHMTFAPGFQVGFQQPGHGFRAPILVFLTGDLCLQLFVRFFMPGQVMHGQFDAQHLVLVFERVKFSGAFGLLLQFFKLVHDFKQQVFHALQVAGGGFEFLLGLVFPGFVLAHSGGLLKHPATGLLAVGEHVLHHVERNNGV